MKIDRPSFEALQPEREPAWTVVFRVYGAPVGYSRIQAFGRKIAKTEAWRDVIRGAFMNATEPALWNPWIGAMKGEIWIFGPKGDLDNYAKEAMDALSKTFIGDDRYFVSVAPHAPFRLVFADGSTGYHPPEGFDFIGLEIRLTAYLPDEKPSKKSIKRKHGNHRC